MKKKNQNWGQQGIRSKQNKKKQKNKNTGSTHKITEDKIKTKA